MNHEGRISLDSGKEHWNMERRWLYHMKPKVKRLGWSLAHRIKIDEEDGLLLNTSPLGGLNVRSSKDLSKLWSISRVRRRQYPLVAADTIIIGWGSSVCSLGVWRRICNIRRPRPITSSLGQGLESEPIRNPPASSREPTQASAHNTEHRT